MNEWSQDVNNTPCRSLRCACLGAVQSFNYTDETLRVKISQLGTEVNGTISDYASIYCNTAEQCVNTGVCLTPKLCTRSANMWTQISVDRKKNNNDFLLFG